MRCKIPNAQPKSLSRRKENQMTKTKVYKKPLKRKVLHKMPKYKAQTLHRNLNVYIYRHDQQQKQDMVSGTLL